MGRKKMAGGARRAIAKAKEELNRNPHSAAAQRRYEEAIAKDKRPLKPNDTLYPKLDQSLAERIAAVCDKITRDPNPGSERRLQELLAEQAQQTAPPPVKPSFNSTSNKPLDFDLEPPMTLAGQIAGVQNYIMRKPTLFSIRRLQQLVDEQQSKSSPAAKPSALPSPPHPELPTSIPSPSIPPPSHPPPSSPPANNAAPALSSEPTADNQPSLRSQQQPHLGLNWKEFLQQA